MIFFIFFSSFYYPNSALPAAAFDNEYHNVLSLNQQGRRMMNDGNQEGKANRAGAIEDACRALRGGEQDECFRFFEERAEDGGQEPPDED